MNKKTYFILLLGLCSASSRLMNFGQQGNTEENKYRDSVNVHEQANKPIAFCSGSGTLWCYDKDNYMFAVNDKVTWWGSEKEWNEKPNDGSWQYPEKSPRDVAKALAPAQPSFFTKEERDKMSGKP